MRNGTLARASRNKVVGVVGVIHRRGRCLHYSVEVDLELLQLFHGSIDLGLVGLLVLRTNGWSGRSAAGRRNGIRGDHTPSHSPARLEGLDLIALSLDGGLEGGCVEQVGLDHVFRARDAESGTVRWQTGIIAPHLACSAHK